MMKKLVPELLGTFGLACRFGLHQHAACRLVGAFAVTFFCAFFFRACSILAPTGGSAGQSFVLEVILTFFLMLVIRSLSTAAKEKGITAGLAVGAVIASKALFAGPRIRRFDEPGSFHGSGAGQRRDGATLDLCRSAAARSVTGRSRVLRGPRAGLLLRWRPDVK